MTNSDWMLGHYELTWRLYEFKPVHMPRQTDIQLRLARADLFILKLMRVLLH